MFVREYLITCCAFGDQDLVPTCLFAAIKPPDDLDDADVPTHVRALMQQIVNEMPMHMRRADAYGKRPDTGDMFWEACPSPVELAEGKEPVPWLTTPR